MDKLSQAEYNVAKFLGFYKAPGRGQKPQPVVEFGGSHYNKYGHKVDTANWKRVDI